MAPKLAPNPAAIREARLRDVFHQVTEEKRPAINDHGRHGPFDAVQMRRESIPATEHTSAGSRKASSTRCCQKIAQVKQTAYQASDNVRAANSISRLTGCRRGEACKTEAEDITESLTHVRADMTKRRVLPRGLHHRGLAALARLSADGNHPPLASNRASPWTGRPLASATSGFTT